MQALVTVTPETDANELTVSALRSRLTAAGVRHGMRTEELEHELEAAREHARSSGSPREVLAAEGTLPQPGASERLVLLEHPHVPPELRGKAKRLFREYGAPRARRSVCETVTVRRPSGRRGLFGIVGGRTEWKEVTEEREREIAGTVVRKLRAVRMVPEGALIARIEPQRLGRPGRTVTGESIPARRPVDPWVYAGDYVRIEGRDVYAEAHGFLRVGPNWLDIVPYRRHDWRITLSPDRGDCRLTYTPGEDFDSRPSADAVLEEARRSGYPADALKDAESVQAMIDRAAGERCGLVEASIATSLNGFLNIEISSDRLRAYLHLIKGRGGGRPLQPSRVGNAIAKSGIRNIDRAKVRADLSAFFRSGETELRDYLLSEGTPPQRGPDPAIDFALRDVSDSQRNRMISLLSSNPELAGTGAGLEEFPPRTIQHVAPVEEDQHILTIAPSVPGDPGIDVFGKPIPGDPGPEPELHLYGGAVRKKSFVLATADGVVDRRRDGQRIYIRVRPHRDVSVRCRVSGDELSAYLTITPHEGTGHTLTEEMLREALAERGITYGVRDEAIAEALESDKPGGEPSTVLVARGRVGSKRGGPTVQLFVTLPNEEKVRILRNRDHIATVTAGQPIAEVFRDAPKGPGMTVHGSQVEARDDASGMLHAGENVYSTATEEGATLLIAAADGRLVIEENVVHVLTTHTIDGDVDMSSGNVEFPSAVDIAGSARSGFAVVAEGDVRIGEMVEAALVSSNGNVTIGGGVKGAGRGVIRSKGRLTAPFIERARVFAVGDISLRTGAMLSSIKCNAKLVCDRKRSRIVGGEIKVKHGLEVVDLGSEKGVRTAVSFGQDYLTEHRIGDIEKRFERAQRRLLAVDRRMGELSGGELSKAQREKATLMKEMEHYSVQLFTLREKLEEHTDSEIRVYGTLYPGVVFESHGRTREIREKVQRICLRFDPETGKIVSEPIEAV